VGGVLRCDCKIPVVFGQEIRFVWRGRESEGPITFADGNVGSITFVSQGRFVGTVTGAGMPDVRLFGENEGWETDDDECRWDPETRRWEEEWDGYNERQYEYENRARWGGGWGAW
jgi:hypothetical protein